MRGLLGILKSLQRKSKINPYYLLSSLVVAGILGGVIGSLVAKTGKSLSWEIAFLFGYAGTDFIEGLQKMYLKRFLFPSQRV